MIWPFNKQETIPFEEHVKTLPMPKCGNRLRHYSHEYNGAVCMDCRFVEADELEQAKENRLARKIAEQVVTLIEEKETK